ncbi:MAG: AsmA-like C-terminal domain-containing protein [Alphaproteobacteria bacterium]|nr:AsmA-like C-terminal domain-containing protein [Alphaproteobacteria bacterium]
MKKVSNKLYLTRRILDYTGVIFLLLLLIFIWQLYKGPIAVPFLQPYIVKALNHDNGEYQVTVESVNLELVRSIRPIKIIANNVVYRKNDETFVVNAPRTFVSFSIKALLRGVVAPSSIEVKDPSVYIFTTYGVKDKNKKDEVSKKKLEYYFDEFEDFIEKFNSEDNTYPESYINDIRVKNAEVEFHEVDLGRKWILSDVNYSFERNLMNIETEVNALLNVQDKSIPIGLEAEYRPISNKIGLQVYFSDLIPYAVMDNLLNDERIPGLYKINLPVSGKIGGMVNIAEVMKNKEDIIKSLDTAVEKLNFQVEGGSGNILFEDNEDSAYKISSFLLEGTIAGGLNRLNIKDADFDLGGQKTKLSFSAEGMKKLLLEGSLQDLKLTLQAKVDNMKFDDLSKYWPKYIATPAWEWCKDSIYGGEIKNADFSFDFAYDKKKQAFAFDKLSGVGDIEDSNLNYLTGMPDLKNLYGRAEFSNDTIKINVDKGVSEEVFLTGGFVKLYDLNKYDNFAEIDLVMSSSITDALKMIDHPPLGYTSDLGLDPSAIKGDTETELKLNFELKNDLKPEEVKVEVKSNLLNVEIPDVIKGKALTAEELKLLVTNEGMSVIGEAKLEDIPIALVWDENFNNKDYKSKYKISFKLNEETKKKLGINFGILNPPYISGYANVDAEILAYNDDKTIVNLKANLNNADIDYSFLGFKKDVNLPAVITAKLDIKKDKLNGIPSFSLSKSDFSLKGKIDLDKNGDVKIVDIYDIKGPKTSAKAKIEFANTKKQKVKLNVSGNSYDLTEFFDKKENSSKTKKSSSKNDDDDDLENVTDADIFIAVNKLWTNPNVPVTNFAGTAKLVNGVGVQEMHMVGNYGNKKDITLKFDYVPRPNGEFLLAIDSNNAGATLKVLRIYDNMSGGNLRIEAKRNKNKEFIGHAKMRDFSIHNTPVVAKLLTVASFTGMLNLLTGEGLAFSHADAPFEYKNKVLSLKEAKAFGNVMGITANGSYDRRQEEFDIKGVIAPAYSINTFIGKIPLVGNLLSGKDGTVFAANYSITGDLSDPQVNINPLSALSPSSLKDLMNSLFGNKNEKKQR